MKTDDEKFEEVLLYLDRKIECCPHADHGYFGGPDDAPVHTKYSKPVWGPYLVQRLAQNSVFAPCEKHLFHYVSPTYRRSK